MKHFKNIKIIVGLIVVMCGCTEIYIPNVNQDSSMLIVEGLITNGAGPFTIKLSQSVPFDLDSTSVYKPVSGAQVKIIAGKNISYQLTSAGNGIYNVPPVFKGTVGETYKLHIETADGNIYESNSQTLLAPQKFDTIQGYYTSQNYMDVNKNYNTVDGADIRVDLFNHVSTAVTPPLCRFRTDITVQYTYEDPVTDATVWHWFYFGWNSFNLNGNENITDERSLSPQGAIKNHSLGFVPFGIKSYGYSMPPSTQIRFYYLRCKQYTINADTYNFYKAANNQLVATGKIFDPVTSQLYGNIKCINDPTKVVLGLFEVSSVTQSAFLIFSSESTKKILLTKSNYIDIPPAGNKQYKILDKDPSTVTVDSTFTPIPFPSWWDH